jgi:hypothetical protein
MADFGRAAETIWTRLPDARAQTKIRLRQKGDSRAGANGAPQLRD